MTDNSKYPEEGDTMNDSSLNATEIAVGSLLAGRNGGGGGGGAWGGGYGGYGAHGAYSVGANSIRIDEHAKAHSAGLENLLDQNQFATTNKNIVDGFNRESDTSSINVNRVADNQFRAELRQSDQRAAALAVTNDMRAEMAKCCCETQKAIADAAKDAASCCCEAKLQACKDHGELKASILADGALTRALMTSTALDAANAKIIQLETINALSRHHG
jgi:hypothetical protein